MNFTMSVRTNVFIFINSICFVLSIVVKDVPPSLTTCNRDDIDLDECLKKTIQAAFITLANGLPEIGMKPLDPYIDPHFTIEYKRNQISGKASLENTKAYGIGDTKVIAVRSNIQDDSFEMELDLRTKEISFEGTLKGEGRLNALALKAQGYYNNTMYDLEYTLKISGKPEMKKGIKYLKINKFSMRPEVRDMKVVIPNVTDNAEINRLAHFYVNRYWRTIYNELLPIVEVVWQKVGTRMCNRLFTKIPYDKLFPYNEY